MRRGGVILYPTEGVWGLGCDPTCTPAIRRILRLKGRSARKGLILLAGSSSALKPWVRGPLPPAPDSSPRATTLLVRPGRRPSLRWLRGQNPRLAVRVTRHPPVVALCQAAGGVLTSTSANRSGCPTPRTRWSAQRYWGPWVDAIMVAPLGGERRPSRIFDTFSGSWIRP